MIRKDKTELRSRLYISKSLNSVMRVKMSFPEQIQPCYNWKPDKELLKNVNLHEKNTIALIQARVLNK